MTTHSKDNTKVVYSTYELTHTEDRPRVMHVIDIKKNGSIKHAQY